MVFPRVKSCGAVSELINAQHGLFLELYRRYIRKIKQFSHAMHKTHKMVEQKA